MQHTKNGRKLRTSVHGNLNHEQLGQVVGGIAPAAAFAIAAAAAASAVVIKEGEGTPFSEAFKDAAEKATEQS